MKQMKRCFMLMVLCVITLLSGCAQTTDVASEMFELDLEISSSIEVNRDFEVSPSVESHSEQTEELSYSGSFFVLKIYDKNNQVVQTVPEVSAQVMKSVQIEPGQVINPDRPDDNDEKLKLSLSEQGDYVLKLTTTFYRKSDGQKFELEQTKTVQVE